MSVTIISKIKEPKKVRSYVTVAVAKPTQSSERPWTKVNYSNQRSNKAKLPPTGTIKQCGRKIYFLCKMEGQHKSEADLMLALNEALQKTRINPKICFCYIRYVPLGSISALLTEKADTAMFFL